MTGRSSSSATKTASGGRDGTGRLYQLLRADGSHFECYEAASPEAALDACARRRNGLDNYATALPSWPLLGELTAHIVPLDTARDVPALGHLEGRPYVADERHIPTRRLYLMASLVRECGLFRGAGAVTEVGARLAAHARLVGDLRRLAREVGCAIEALASDPGGGWSSVRASP